MNKKFAASTAFTVILIFLYSCGSGQYNIEHGNYPDTTYKSTGAKLKGTYKIRSVPKFTLMVNGGINLGLAELSSNYSDIFDARQFLEGQNFGVKTGFGFQVVGKIPLHKKGNVRLNLSGGFNRFQSNMFISSSFGNVSYNVMSFGAGLENSFAPTLKLKPYVAGEIQANLISGKANIIDPVNNTTRNVKIKNTFRIGYVIYSGFEYMLSNQWGFNFGLKLSNVNQVLKKSVLENDPDVVSIRDKKVDGDPIEFAGFKNFIYTTFFIGANFYFGIHDILYKF